jgi:hypothetical protein
MMMADRRKIRRKIITGKEVSHNGVKLISDTDGKVTMQVPGQPQVELTSAQYLHLADLLGHMYEWEDI